jgi:hypothetical protein
VYVGAGLKSVSPSSHKSMNVYHPASGPGSVSELGFTLTARLYSVFGSRPGTVSSSKFVVSSHVAGTPPFS